jgi:NAD(P)-dependent dehydrogenase (short-subunit alcohol dehydrogenase family)
VSAAVDEAARVLGGLDVLVNNAGIFRAGPLETLTREDIDATLAVNVRAVVVASQAAAARMEAGGRIISIGSCLAERVADPGVSLDALSKAALVGWTKGLSRDLGPRGITVNVVHPGPTDTDMNPADGPGADEQRARMAIPRFGRPEDVAALVVLVAGPQGARHRQRQPDDRRRHQRVSAPPTTGAGGPQRHPHSSHDALARRGTPSLPTERRRVAIGGRRVRLQG